MPSPITSLTDAELAARFQADGDGAALEELLSRYRRFARGRSRGYFLVGGDHDDVEQEALIGLYKACRDYRPGHQASFRAFADLCIRRQIITAIKTATRQKHQPLNQYVSISGPRPSDDSDESTPGDEIIDLRSDDDPEARVVDDERLSLLEDTMDQVLSELEVDVLELYVAGRSYQEIGEELGRHTKSIDNALQRIKRKMDRHLRAEVTARSLIEA